MWRTRWMVALAVSLMVAFSGIASTLSLGRITILMRALEGLDIPRQESLVNETKAETLVNQIITHIPGVAVSGKEIQHAKSISSVDYYACCGLGHRMSKLADASYIAYKRNFGLRVNFGFCNETAEVFHHFFGAQPLSQISNLTHYGWSLKIANEAPCFSRFKRTGNDADCQCPQEYMGQSERFYQDLINRFRNKQEVKDFRRRYHFDNHTVIGIHIRAGNGEQGDFVTKNRGIQNSTLWVESMASLLKNMSKDWTEKPPLLFVATDTGSMVHDLRQHLHGEMDVVDYQQERVTNGGGVVFGAQGAREQPKDDECLMHWKNSLMDMMLLASTDVVVAGRPSSFTQSLPMSIALGRKNRKIPHTYCEVALMLVQLFAMLTLKTGAVVGVQRFISRASSPTSFEICHENHSTLLVVWRSICTKGRITSAIHFSPLTISANRHFCRMIGIWLRLRKAMGITASPMK